MQSAVQHRLEGGQTLGGRVAQALVAGHHIPVRRWAACRRLMLFAQAGSSAPSTGASIGETSRSNRCSSQARLAFCWETSPRWSRSDQVRPRRLAIRSAAVNWSGMSISQDSARILERSVRRWHQADAAHRLDTAGDSDVDGSGGDQAGDQVVGLLGTAALAVDGRGADVIGQTCRQPGDPGDVVGLLPELCHASADGLFHLPRVDSRLLDDGLLDGSE